MTFERAMVAATVIGGLLYFAYDENDEVVGVACWFQPGHAFLKEYGLHTSHIYVLY